MSKFKVGDVVRVVDNSQCPHVKVGHIGTIKSIDGLVGNCCFIGVGCFAPHRLELVTHAPEEQPDDPDMVTYTITVPRDMFPFAPGSEVVCRNKGIDKEWIKGEFCLYHKDFDACPYHIKFMDIHLDADFDWFSECHPLSTHGHLLDTTYPEDTPACAKCGKAAPHDNNNMRFRIDGMVVCEECFNQLNQHSEFKPFQQVLVRNSEKNYWEPYLFSYRKSTARTEEDLFIYKTIGGGTWRYCIPYEGNEHLAGTTEAPE